MNEEELPQRPVQNWLGSCHCRNITYEFETHLARQEIWLRKCSCLFCTKQGNINFADPKGQARVKITDRSQLIRYQMGHQTSERFICGICGIYLGGFMKFKEQSVCVLNFNTLDDRDGFSDPTTIDVSRQSPDERMEGRLKRWTPYEMNCL